MYWVALLFNQIILPLCTLTYRWLCSGVLSLDHQCQWLLLLLGLPGFVRTRHIQMLLIWCNILRCIKHITSHRHFPSMHCWYRFVLCKPTKYDWFIPLISINKEKHCAWILYTRLLSLFLKEEHFHSDQVLLKIESSTYPSTFLITGSFPQTSFCLHLFKSYLPLHYWAVPVWVTQDMSLSQYNLWSCPISSQQPSQFEGMWLPYRQLTATKPCQKSNWEPHKYITLSK